MKVDLEDPNLVFAVDFETDYDDKISVTTMGPLAYAERTHVYLVAIVCSDGQKWVGHPKDAPWEDMDGYVWVSHNRTFDESMYRSLGIQWKPSVWECTADLAAYLGYARSLKACAEHMLGKEISKAVRDDAKGKRWPIDYTEEQQQAMIDYAHVDSELCLEIWEKYADEWPEHERWQSRFTTQMSLQGIRLDVTQTWEASHALETLLGEAYDRVPWHGKYICVDEEEEQGRFWSDEPLGLTPKTKRTKKRKPVPLTSPRAIKWHCEQIGIEPPTTMARNAEEFAAWKIDNRDHCDFALALGDIRSLNRTLKVVEKLRNGVAGDGRIHYALKYFGAVTGRWSGDGVNLQNLPREAKGGVSLRNLLIPAPGHQFYICDFSQIEAVVTLWLAGETAQLKLFADGMDIYEAHARATMGYEDERPLKVVDPGLRQLAKARVLGLGFGCGSARFRIMAFQLVGLELTEEECAEVVLAYRASNPEIVDLWKKLGKSLFRAVENGRNFTMGLRSGRKIHYRTASEGEDGVKVEPVKGQNKVFTYGAKLTENLVQATARELLAIAIRNLTDAGYRIVLTVHDEVVVEIPEKDCTAETAAHVESIMTAKPDWAEELPLRAAGEFAERYTK